MEGGWNDGNQESEIHPPGPVVGQDEVKQTDGGVGPESAYHTLFLKTQNEKNPDGWKKELEMRFLLSFQSNTVPQKADDDCEGRAGDHPSLMPKVVQRERKDKNQSRQTNPFDDHVFITLENISIHLFAPPKPFGLRLANDYGEKM